MDSWVGPPPDDNIRTERPVEPQPQAAPSTEQGAADDTRTKRILTGDRPTGKLHLGHYVGSVRHRVALQKQYEGYRGVDDDYVHAGTDALDKWWDWKFGIRIHWSAYSVTGNGPESWPLNPNYGGDTQFREQYEQTRAGLLKSGRHATALSFFSTISRKPRSRAMRSRNSYISGNFRLVSMCMSGNGMGPGWNAFCARRSRQAESLPTDHSITGLRNSAKTSRMMWIDSDSSALRCVSEYVISASWCHAHGPGPARARRRPATLPPSHGLSP